MQKRNNSSPQTSTVSTKKKSLVIFLKVFIVIFLVLLIGVVFSVGLFYYTWWYQLKLHAHLTDRQVLALIQDGLKTPIQATHQHKNILLLGTDALANRSGDPVLTDTMMVFSLNLETGDLRALSLPRDLWSIDYKTKINSLYEYGKKKYPAKPEQFPTEVVQDLTQVHLDNTIVISLDQLKEVIDDLGGISVDIPESFVDDQFPRTDVNIKTEHDPKKLYETVQFTQGVERMSGDRALKYVRSRHSSQTDQGTDNARTVRQQLVINAIIAKLKEPSTLKNPIIVGQLFDWYERNFQTELPIEEVIKIASLLQKKVLNVILQPQTLSFELNGQTGVIIHPPEKKYNQWVYEVKDLEEFRTEVSHKLGLL